MKAKRSAVSTRSVRILRLRTELRWVKPPIRRILDVPETLSLARLHGALQILHGWDDSHLWQFESQAGRWAPQNAEMDAPGQRSTDPRKSRVIEVFPAPGARLAYNYDFGDDWWVDLTLEAVRNPESGTAYPRCVSGERAGPPDDCGGPPGYEQLLDARRHPESADARELLEWVGPGWDPEAFDLVAVNKALAGLPTPRRVQ